VSPSPWWIAVSAPVCVLAIGLLIRVIRSLIRTTRASVVSSFPLRERQIVALPSAGDYDLYVEGRHFSRDFGGLDFALTDAAGASLPLRGSLFRTEVSSLSRVRLKLRSFRAPAAGDFTLSVTGIPAAQDPANRLVVARPFVAALIGHVLGLIAVSVLVIGSLGATIALGLLARGWVPSQ